MYIFQYKCSGNEEWFDVLQVPTDNNSYEICSFSPRDDVQCNLRALNQAGFSPVAYSSAFKTPCLRKYSIVL